MEELTISEVARRAGIRTSAIRYYESVKLLPAPQRINGRRRYTPDVLRQLSFIQAAQLLGFTVSEMKILFNEWEGSAPLSERWETLAQQKLAEVNALIRRAHGMKMMLENGLHCNCEDLDQCIDCVLKLQCTG